jgi:hypothetical protein
MNEAEARKAAEDAGFVVKDVRIIKEPLLIQSGKDARRLRRIAERQDRAAAKLRHPSNAAIQGRFER